MTSRSCVSTWLVSIATTAALQACSLDHSLGEVLLDAATSDESAADESASDGAVPDSGIGAASKRDAGPDEDVMHAPDASGQAADAATATGTGDCVPNPGSSDGLCPEICPEVCDNNDNDCDRRIDEDADGMCALSHAVAVCSQGTCGVVACDSGYRDCDDDPSNGCEASPDDVNNCGACGVVCSVADGMSACLNDQCTF